MYEIGQRGVNKQGLSYVILEAKLMKKIRIRFDIDGAEVVTTNTYIKQGLPMHPTHGKWKVGDIYQDKNGLDFELAAKISSSKWKIRYLKDGAECERETSSIKDKYGSHPIENKVLIGQKYKTNHGEVTVVDVKSSIDVIVQFEDGATHRTSSSQLRSGNVGHPSSNLVVGQKYKTNSGWEYTIEKYVSPMKCMFVCRTTLLRK